MTDHTKALADALAEEVKAEELADIAALRETRAVQRAAPAQQAEPAAAILIQDFREFAYRAQAHIPFDEAQWFGQRADAIQAALGALAQQAAPSLTVGERADFRVNWIDGVGACRTSLEHCRDGVSFIEVDGRCYYPLTDAAHSDLIAARFGRGVFPPPQPAAQAEPVALPGTETMKAVVEHAFRCGASWMLSAHDEHGHDFQEWDRVVKGWVAEWVDSEHNPLSHPPAQGVELPPLPAMPLVITSAECPAWNERQVKDYATAYARAALAQAPAAALLGAAIAPAYDEALAQHAADAEKWFARDMKDAARYRWLRENSTEYKLTQKDGYGGRELLGWEALDEAIDAALAQAQKEQQHG